MVQNAIPIQGDGGPSFAESHSKHCFSTGNRSSSRLCCGQAEEALDKRGLPGYVVFGNHLICPLRIMFIVSIR